MKSANSSQTIVFSCLPPTSLPLSLSLFQSLLHYSASTLPTFPSSTGTSNFKPLSPLTAHKSSELQHIVTENPSNSKAALWPQPIHSLLPSSHLHCSYATWWGSS